METKCIALYIAVYIAHLKAVPSPPKKNFNKKEL